MPEIPPDGEEALRHDAGVLIEETVEYLHRRCSCCGCDRPADGRTICDGCIAADCVVPAGCNRDIDIEVEASDG